MAQPIYWTPERLEVFREAYERGGPKAAQLKFPDKTLNNLCMVASLRGIKGPARRSADASAPNAEEIAARRAAREARKRENEAAARKKVADRQAARADRERKLLLANATDRYDASIARARAALADIAKCDPAFKTHVVMIDRSKLAELTAAQAPPPRPEGYQAHTGPAVVRPVGRIRFELPRGDVEHVRRRLANVVIPQIASELRRSPYAIVDAILGLAARDFERDAIGKVRTDPEDAYGDRVDTKASQ